MSRRSVILTLTLIIIMGAGAWFYLSRTLPPQPERISIGTGSNPVYSVLYVAESNGYFKDEQVEVEQIRFPTGKDALTQVIEGKIDLATGYQTPVLLRALEGHRLKILTTLHSGKNATAVVARKDAGIRRVEDLRGKRIGVASETNAELFLGLLLKSYGISEKQVTFVSLPPLGIHKSLVAGEVDAISTWQPEIFLSQLALEPGKTVSFDMDSYAEMSLLVGLETTMETKSDAIRRLLRALTRAEDFIRKNPKEAFQIVVKTFPNQSESALRAVWDSSVAELKLDNLLLASMEQELDYFRSQGSMRSNALLARNLVEIAPLSEVAPEAVTILHLYMNGAMR